MGEPPMGARDDEKLPRPANNESMDSCAAVAEAAGAAAACALCWAWPRLAPERRLKPGSSAAFVGVLALGAEDESRSPTGAALVCVGAEADTDGRDGADTDASGARRGALLAEPRRSRSRMLSARAGEVAVGIGAGMGARLGAAVKIADAEEKVTSSRSEALAFRCMEGFTCVGGSAEVARGVNAS
jgi:hypothetical protein